MLTVRQEQEEALRQRALAQYEVRAVAHLRRDLSKPTSSFSDDELRQRLRLGVPRAAKYGLTTEKHVMYFVDVSFLLGNHFDSDPSQKWAADLLRSLKLSAADKANLLLATACSIYQERESAK